MGNQAMVILSGDPYIAKCQLEFKDVGDRTLQWLYLKCLCVKECFYLLLDISALESVII